MLAVPTANSQAPGEDNCYNCHKDFEEDDGPSHLFERDVHFQRGIGCSGCHGGDPTMEDMDEVWEAESFVGVPRVLEIPEFCAKCHSDPGYMREHNPSLATDQLEKYRTSVHGQRLFEHQDEKVANCVSCHSAHSIANAKLPYSTTHPKRLPELCGSCHADADYMAEYGIPTNQLEEYKASVHGVALLERDDLGAPACNDCHSNHGAAPPGVTSLSAVCGGCHAIEAQLYEHSPHQAAFEENGFPMCETCHSKHAIEKPTDVWISLTDPGVCGDCHASDDGTEAPATIDRITSGLGELLSAAELARTFHAEAREKGMMTTDIEFLVKDVDQAIIKARTHVHAFSADSVLQQVKAGVGTAEEAQKKAASLIDEYYFRRRGLAIATVIMTLLAVLLYIKIRRIERR